MFGSLGPMELGIIALLALLLFGAGRIADVGKGLGQSIKNFRTAMREGEEIAKSADLTPPASASAAAPAGTRPAG